jgi:hypothetical protein
MFHSGWIGEDNGTSGMVQFLHLQTFIVRVKIRSPLLLWKSIQLKLLGWVSTQLFFVILRRRLTLSVCMIFVKKYLWLNWMNLFRMMIRMTRKSIVLLYMYL